MDALIDGMLLTPLREIAAPGGAVLHAMKAADAGYHGFGEAYFSTVDRGAVKGWKRHLRMTLNLVVPAGEIRFVLHDPREASPTRGVTASVRLSRTANYQRLTVPPGIWMAFQGVAAPSSMLLNVADLPHDPAEAERCDPATFPFDWTL